jgi:hypothetical protein
MFSAYIYNLVLLAASYGTTTTGIVQSSSNQTRGTHAKVHYNCIASIGRGFILLLYSKESLKIDSRKNYGLLARESVQLCGNSEA